MRLSFVRSLPPPPLEACALDCCYVSDPGVEGRRIGVESRRGDRGEWALSDFRGSWILCFLQRRAFFFRFFSLCSPPTQAADVYSELRRKVLVKKERQSLEGQLSSLIRIEGNTMSCKVGLFGRVRRRRLEQREKQNTPRSPCRNLKSNRFQTRFDCTSFYRETKTQNQTFFFFMRISSFSSTEYIAEGPLV